jgi:hypothetical protein
MKDNSGFLGYNISGDDITMYNPNGSADQPRCASCEHFVAPNGCNGPSMQKYSDQPRLPDGNVRVVRSGWCRFYESKDCNE